MAEIDLSLAGEADEADLRRLLRENPLPGRIQVTFECEPNFFRAADVEGDLHQTIAMRDGERLVGMVTRSVRAVWREGQPEALGYFSQMRLLPGYRAIPQTLARVGRMLQALDGDGRCVLYLTSIIADNLPARRLLTSGRPGFARLHEAARYHTLAVPTRRPRLSAVLPPNLHLEQGRPHHIPAVLGCLEAYGKHHPFSPRWTAENLFTNQHTPHLRPEDFWLVLDGPHLVGCLALWDQTPFKQTVVRGYAGWLRYARPLVNLLAPLTGYPYLPAANAPFHYCFASHLALSPHLTDPAPVFTALLQRVHHSAWEHGFSYIMLGLDERHPLLAAAKQAFPHIDYTSQFYFSSWQDDGLAQHASQDPHPLGIEAALL